MFTTEISARPKYLLKKQMNAAKLVIDYLEKNDKSQAQLARLINESPQNLGKKLRSEYMAVDMLEKISDALNHNFFHDLSEQWEREHFNIDKVVANEPGMKYGSPEGLEKYIEILVEKKVAERLKK
jgi:hypothetical protein